VALRPRNPAGRDRRSPNSCRWRASSRRRLPRSNSRSLLRAMVHTSRLCISARASTWSRRLPVAVARHARVWVRGGRAGCHDGTTRRSRSAPGRRIDTGTGPRLPSFFSQIARPERRAPQHGVHHLPDKRIGHPQNCVVDVCISRLGRFPAADDGGGCAASRHDRAPPRIRSDIAAVCPAPVGWGRFARSAVRRISARSPLVRRDPGSPCCAGDRRAGGGGHA
jgi:hypothetical protein